MGEKLSFLKKYKKNIRIIPYHEINKLGCSEIPSSWFELFQEENTSKRVEAILKVWEKQAGAELRNTISYLSMHLVEVELMETDGKYSILYTIKTDTGEILYYEGGNPKAEFNNEALETNWGGFPSSIQDFYQTVHNGFYFYASHSMGLVPLKEVTFFDDDEWGIIEELEEPLQIDLQTTFGFFKNGSGGYVAVDYKNCINDNATLWWTNEEPKYNVDFWDVVDEWIVIGFQL
ncbi:hypothetical protein [Bacillus sp. WC2507]|uniref:hypothetical protein n=1 Tax=Bacillus sp. WC2507 TaxID=3461404 RepID=UPI00032E60F0|nr:hypothetical protein ICS_02623 [Bacillus cereus BAG2O-3]EOQ11187.1 hypothetical protein KQ3_02266 [Bacillus cereus B5-2]PFI44566.1 SMI1/KNR4 family protein [Bacillus cereus]PGT81639.1 SMI1/KNR4 family protein [Bacillus cereus]